MFFKKLCHLNFLEFHAILPYIIHIRNGGFAMSSNTKYLPTIEELQDNIVIYSRTSKGYETAYSQIPSETQQQLIRLSRHGNVNAVFPYYYELRASNSYLLIYTVNGQGKYTSGDLSVILSPNTLLFIDCDRDHIIELSEANGWDYFFMNIGGPLIDTYYRAYSADHSFIYTLPSISGVSSYIDRIFHLYESREAEVCYDFLQSNLLSGLLTTILSEKKNNASGMSQLPPQLEAVKERFDREYMHAFTLDEIARDEHISKYKLVHDFTEHLGISPINYLIRVRIENAKRMLVATSDPINEIAAAVGIENMNHFIYLFKKSEGVTPGGYRKACWGQRRHLIDGVK